ncbi:Cyclophilin-type peptidyl-prolyl cis-trans isomerase domain [Trinorchestia longiramus]|nr:Cyclophilin-type peptidyl-prolyl cis-trans isomerase domain [Trinorchestia longiramus]
MVQGGDFINNDGTGGESIYGDKFDDEGFSMKHSSRGVLSMANSGPNTNGSQFFITCTDTHHLDNKHVAFGEVVHGIGVVGVIEKTEVMDEKPVQPVVIADCGELAEGADPGIVEVDGTEDIFPQYPEDLPPSQLDLYTAPMSNILEALNKIKASGNHHFKEQNYHEAIYKYRKCLCYIE